MKSKTGAHIMKTLILVHGRSWKPNEPDLKKLWIDALTYGIKRDAPESLDAFKAAKKEFVYYGDISNAYLKKKTGKTPPNDLASRKTTLDLLNVWKANEFTKSKYNKLPGKESFKEGVADVLSPLLRFFHLSDDLINAVAPDMGEYWKGEDSDFGSKAREPMIKPLQRALDQKNNSVCIMAHSLGTMIAYDTLWKFSYRSEYRPKYNNKKIDLFVTLGCPLADETVKGGLFGAQASGARRYPSNINHWVNIAAHDDFVSHDQRVANDFKMMKRYGLIKSIKDHRIYNLSLRKGKSNPHHSGGYLIHPKTTSTLVNWLEN